jgi:hypothetical protein
MQLKGSLHTDQVGHQQPALVAQREHLADVVRLAGEGSLHGLKVPFWTHPTCAGAIGGKQCHA